MNKGDESAAASMFERFLTSARAFTINDQGPNTMKDDTATQEPQTAVAPATPFEMITAAIITSAIVNKMPAGSDPMQDARQVYARMLRYVGRLK